MEKYGIKRIVTCEMLDRYPEARFDIVEEMTRELVSSIVPKLHEGEKIVKLSNVREFQEGKDFQYRTAQLERIVTIDSLIRCKDCRFFEKGFNDRLHCTLYMDAHSPWAESRYEPKPDDFCSRAEGRSK